MFAGLMHNDCLYETPDVEEALRRLPEKLIMERNYRMARAVQLSGLKKVLPKNEWTKYDNSYFSHRIIDGFPRIYNVQL